MTAALAFQPAAQAGPAALPAPAPLRVLVRATPGPAMAAMIAAVRAAGHLATQAGTATEGGAHIGAEVDVVLSDTALPREPGAPLLVLGDAPDESISALPQGVPPAQLDAGLRAVAAGLLVRLPVPASQAAAPRTLLTPRELDILVCLSEGLSNKAAARRLGISAHTVKFHLESVFAKLGATSRADAVARGLRGGMIEL